MTADESVDMAAVSRGEDLYEYTTLGAVSGQQPNLLNFTDGALRLSFGPKLVTCCSLKRLLGGVVLDGIETT